MMFSMVSFARVKIVILFFFCVLPLVSDVRTLVNNDEGLQDGILQALEQYNTEQHITVTLPATDYEVI